MADREININGDTYINGQKVMKASDYPSADEDPFWFLHTTQVTTDTKEELPAPPTDQSDRDIDPKLTRNNTPFQGLERIAGLLERVGIPTEWEQHFPCPCINPNTNQPKSDCPICNGRGVAFRKPYVLQVAYQKNEKGGYNGSYGNNELGTTIATPQMTENGIENGISFRDRLSIPGLTISQDYIFNVTSRRVTNGVFIPYKIVSFDYVVTIGNSGNLQELHEGIDFKYDKNLGKIYPNEAHVGKQISLNITTELRYYVVDISKETRWAQVKKDQDKEIPLNHQGKIFDKYVHDNMNISKGIQVFRLPKLLVLRREDLYYPPASFEDSNGDNSNTNILNTKDNINNSNKDIEDLLGG